MANSVIRGCVVMAMVGVLASAPGPARGDSARVKSKRLNRPTVDAGDVYTTPKGPRRLLRLADAVAVRAADTADHTATIRKLSQPDAPLAGWVEDWRAGQGFVVLKPAKARQAGEPSRVDRSRELLALARRGDGVRSANPVFIDPQSKLWLIPTGEIIVRLKPGGDPQAYFGTDWPRVRALAGCRDQFILALATPDAESMLAEVNRRATDPRVAWVEPNFLGQVIPQSDDPFFPFQWHLNNTGQGGGKANADVNAPEAWKITSGSPDVVIAVIDDGVQIDHPDLAANIFVNPGEDGFDGDNNGYVGDWNGWNFYSDTADPYPSDFNDDHGTATAGVAAAVGDNLRGGAGMAHGCQILPIKVIQGNDGATMEAMAEAVYYAAGSTRDGLSTWRGADVISISLAFDPSQVVDDALSWAVTYGRSGYGCPVFASAGNDASRWQPTRLKIPVGLTLGAGTYSFGFEYRKDETEAEGEDLIQIDNVALLRGDNFTEVNSALGPGGRQDFEGAAFPPAGWQTFASTLSGGQRWMVGTDRPLIGTGGSRSARSGPIPHGSWTQLATPNVTLQGDEILSLSCYASSEIYDGLYVFAYDARGNIIHEFAGPEGFPLASDNIDLLTQVEYPARHPDVSGVGASTDADRRADYSQYGNGLDFVVPSSGGWRDILTTDRTGTNGYAYDPYQTTWSYTFDFGGTSAAAPLAAGVGALLLSADAYLTATEIRTAMRNTCARIGGATYFAGWSTEYGFGRVNAFRALKSVLPNLGLNVADFPDPVAAGSNLLYTVTVTNRGSATAFDVWVEADFPASLSSVDASVDHDFRTNHLTLYFGDLASGNGVVATVQATPQVLGKMTNQFYATSMALDVDPSNDWTNVVTRVRGPDTNAPTVAITSPSENAVVTTTSLQIQGTASDNAGVSLIHYRLENAAGIGPFQSVSNQTASGTINWAGTLSDLFPGTNLVRARAWDASGLVSPDVTRTVFYAVKSRLQVLIQGSGTVTPSWTNQDLDVNQGYTLLATPGAGFVFSNWVARPSGGGAAVVLAGSKQLSFLMQTNLTLEANFVPSPFLPLAGAYNGLFYVLSGVEHESSGAFSLTLRKGGNYTADLQLAGERFGLTGKFALDGRATNLVARSSNTAVRVEWTLNLSRGPTNDVFGSVISLDEAWGAELIGDRAPVYTTTSSPYRGRYTLAIPGSGDPSDTTRPFGDSIATVFVDTKGWLSAAGTLADGTPFTHGAQVSAAGDWPLYVPLHGGRGSLLGWVTLNTNPPPVNSLDSLRLSWIKPAGGAGLYAAGFEMETTLGGSRYLKPTPLLPLTNALLVFTGGGLDEPVGNWVTLTPSNTILNHGPHPLAMTLTRSNGTFSGMLTLTNDGQTLPFRGVLLQRQTNGTGFFLSTNESGRVYFGP